MAKRGLEGLGVMHLGVVHLRSSCTARAGGGGGSHDRAAQATFVQRSHVRLRSMAVLLLLLLLCGRF